jgi:hypothetical protein
VTGARRPYGPDFLVIGAQRAGTTWLHRVLRRHPELWLPPVKELHYFDKLSTSGNWKKERWRRALMSGPSCLDPWHIRYLLGEPNDEWYARLFHKAQQKGLIAGEITPAYAALDEDVFRRIQNLNSEIKLVFVMRDPVERAWSAVNNSFKKGRIGGSLTVEKALARAGLPPFTARSAYTETIKRLEAIFPSRQLYFSFFDDLRDQPDSFTARLLSFLGVNPGVVKRQWLPQAVNSAVPGKPVPLEFQREMAKVYTPMIGKLCERFEGPPHHWRLRYEALVSSRSTAGAP